MGTRTTGNVGTATSRPASTCTTRISGSTAGMSVTRCPTPPDALPRRQRQDRRTVFSEPGPRTTTTSPPGRCLAPFGIDATQVGAAAWHGRNGGIDTLVVALGANNALGSVVDKQVSWSDVGFDNLEHKSVYNVWRPLHFAVEYGELVKSLRTIAPAGWCWPPCHTSPLHRSRRA